MSPSTTPPDYSKSFRRALRNVISAQLDDGIVDPRSEAAEELFNRADPWTIVTAMLETLVTLANDDRPGVDPADRIDQAVDHLRRRKGHKAKR